MDKERIGNILIKSGLTLVIASVLLFIFIFFPTIKSETRYLFFKAPENVVISFDGSRQDQNEIVPADKNFSVIIPKIGINSKIIPNVDPFNEREYRSKLRDGVAHAKGTSFPGRDKRIFLFAHSSDNFYSANQYNSIFYLIRKLEKGDDVSVVYSGDEYKYEVVKTEIVEADRVDFLEKGEKEEIVLMTCWPPGTSMKRLLVFADRK